MIGIVLAVLSFLLLVSHQAITGVSSRPVLLFGQSCPLTGVSAGLGINMMIGIEAAFRQVNNRYGGVAGHDLQLVTVDDQYEPGPCLANTLQFLQNSSIFGLIGYVGTASSEYVLPYVSNASIPFVGPLTGGAGVRIPFRDSVFNMRASYAGRLN